MQILAAVTIRKYGHHRDAKIRYAMLRAQKKEMLHTTLKYLCVMRRLNDH
jgi:hypothetical protein